MNTQTSQGMHGMSAGMSRDDVEADEDESHDDEHKDAQCSHEQKEHVTDCGRSAAQAKVTGPQTRLISLHEVVILSMKTCSIATRSADRLPRRQALIRAPESC
jgi:hypothetical protein